MTYVWRNLPDADFDPCDGLGLISFQGRLRKYAGWNDRDPVNFPGKTINSIHSVDFPHLRPWQLDRGEANFERSHNFALHKVYGRLVKVGGDTQQGHYQPHVHDSPDGDNFRELDLNAPIGERAIFLSIAIDDKVFVFNGQTLPFQADADAIAYTDGYVYDHALRTGSHRGWGQVEHNLPACGATDLVELNGYVYCFGGGTIGMASNNGSETEIPDTFSNAIYRTPDMHGYTLTLDGEGNLTGPPIDWELVGYMPITPRRYLNCAKWEAENAIVILGGADANGNTDDCLLTTDPTDAEAWQNIPFPGTPTHACGLAPHNGGIYKAAGNNFEPDVWLLAKVQDDLPDSLPLETFGPNVSISPLNTDGTYTVSRTGGGQAPGIGARSVDSIEGDYLWEIEPIDPDETFNIYVGVAGALPLPSSYYTSFSTMAQPMSILDNALDFWQGGDYVEGSRRTWAGRVYAERIDGIVRFYSGSDWTLAKGAGPIFEIEDDTDPSWFGAMLRTPTASVKARFISLED